ncbi:hypothetical protein BC834DRAFT_588568 [Gloeopeniophorella convolvens]|nr:hypothetical protein BC834DRAFT_588568 [Gloeopeniophorella convolvens]
MGSDLRYMQKTSSTFDPVGAADLQAGSTLADGVEGVGRSRVDELRVDLCHECYPVSLPQLSELIPNHVRGRDFESKLHDTTIFWTEACSGLNLPTIWHVQQDDSSGRYTRKSDPQAFQCTSSELVSKTTCVTSDSESDSPLPAFGVFGLSFIPKVFTKPHERLYHPRWRCTRIFWAGRQRRGALPPAFLGAKTALSTTIPAYHSHSLLSCPLQKTTLPAP